MSSVSEQAIASKSVAEPTNPSPSTESDTSEEVRKAMTQYWEIHTGDGDLENMMLDSRAAALDKSERPEILQYLPELKTRSVAELGAGSVRISEYQVLNEIYLTHPLLTCMVRRVDSRQHSQKNVNESSRLISLKPA
jgi:hypothetical protein